MQMQWCVLEPAGLAFCAVWICPLGALYSARNPPLKRDLLHSCVYSVMPLLFWPLWPPGEKSHSLSRSCFVQVQIDPYLEDSLCHICSSQPGPFFCRDQVSPQGT